MTTLRLDEVGALEVKIRLEREEPTAKFLLYSPTEEPDYEDDWLLDIRLYSRSFRADRASILLQELGPERISTCGLILPTVASSSTPRTGFRRSRIWSPRMIAPPTSTAR